MVSANSALVVPPPGGPAVVSVLQHDFSNAVTQEIFLFTSAGAPGQNVLRVTMFGPVGLEYDDRKSLGYNSLRDETVNADMRRELPGVAMARSAYFVQNSYGPFGYAFGRSAYGDTCLYAWQQIRSSANARAAFINRGTIQLRLRVCDAHATQEQLLGLMYGITIVGTFPAPGWNPLDGPPPVDPTLGRAGNPIYPGITAGRTTPMASFQTGPDVAPAPRARPVVRAPVEAAPALLPVGPIVPSPLAPAGNAATRGAAVAPNSAIVPAPNCVAAVGGGCK